MYLVTAQQMKSAEDAANQSGLSYDAMMEHAGKAVAEAIDGEFGAAGKQMVVLVGPGNNGGDGLVAARYLADLGPPYRFISGSDLIWLRMSTGNGWPITLWRYSKRRMTLKVIIWPPAWTKAPL